MSWYVFNRVPITFSFTYFIGELWKIESSAHLLRTYPPSASQICKQYYLLITAAKFDLLLYQYFLDQGMKKCFIFCDP